jgi:hypothetical protein
MTRVRAAAERNINTATEEISKYLQTNFQVCIILFHRNPLFYKVLQRSVKFLLVMSFFVIT